MSSSSKNDLSSTQFRHGGEKADSSLSFSNQGIPFSDNQNEDNNTFQSPSTTTTGATMTTTSSSLSAASTSTPSKSNRTPIKKSESSIRSSLRWLGGNSNSTKDSQSHFSQHQPFKKYIYFCTKI